MPAYPKDGEGRGLPPFTSVPFFWGGGGRGEERGCWNCCSRHVWEKDRHLLFQCLDLAAGGVGLDMCGTKSTTFYSSALAWLLEALV